MINWMIPADFREVIKSLAQTPLVLERLCEELAPAELSFKDTEVFSALENICHLRDLEIEGYGERIVRILNEDNPSLRDFDGARLAIERDYNNQDARAALAAFNEARSRNLEALKNLNPEQVAREGTLEGVGVINLEKLVEMMVEHDQGHLEEMLTISRRSQRRSETSAV